MNLHRVGVACAVALLATCALLAPACSSKTIVEVIDPSVDAEPKPFGSDGASSLPGDDAAVVDATLSPIRKRSARDRAARHRSARHRTARYRSARHRSARHRTARHGHHGRADPGALERRRRLRRRRRPAVPRRHVLGVRHVDQRHVYDPAGKNPIPSRLVFVPTAASGKTRITPGANTCDTCDLPIGSYVTATMSDATGKFTLTGVPTGTQVPVVLQLGKWRREFFVATASCQDTVLAAGKARLPRNRSEEICRPWRCSPAAWTTSGAFSRE